MAGNTHFDPTGEKKARKKATFGGAIVCAMVNVSLGGLLGFCVLASTAPQEYPAKPDPKAPKSAAAKTDKPSGPPAGLFYWAGEKGGSFKDKEAQLFVDKPGSVTVTDGELNAWAADSFKALPPLPVAAAPAPKPAASSASASGTVAAPKSTVSEAAKVKAEAQAAEASLQDTGLTPGTPNFHIFKDPQAPADVLLSMQIAVPLSINLLGVRMDTVYQARGVFVSGPQGPEFKPYYSFIGNARVPGPLAQSLFNSFAAKFAGSDAAKKAAEVWPKIASATVKDGALVLAGK